MEDLLRDPYTRVDGHQRSWLTYDAKGVDEEERLVLFDRREIDPKAKHLDDQPWEVRHMPSGRFKLYADRELAESDAYRCADSAHDWNQWWKDKE
ncbi:hypothetical protein [Agrobacterium burrii]